MSIISKVSVSPTEVRNSELFKLVQKGILKVDSPVEAKLPSGRSIEVKMNADNTITKSFTNAKGHLVEAEFDIVRDGTRLRFINENTPIGIIEQVYTKNGETGGHIWTSNSRPFSNDYIVWEYSGLINKPETASTVIHQGPNRNNNSIDAFKAAVDYIRGNGSLAAYKAQMAK